MTMRNNKRQNQFPTNSSNAIPMALHGPKRKKLRCESSLLFVGLLAAVTFHRPNFNQRNANRVTAFQQPTALSHLFHHSSNRRQQSLIPHSILSESPVVGSRKRGGSLHALEIAPIPPRGSRALQGERSPEEATPILDDIYHGNNSPMVDLHSVPLFEASSDLHSDPSHSFVTHPNGSSAQSTQSTPPNALDATEEGALIASMALGFTMLVATILKFSPPGCWRYYLAGGICASTSHAITTPIDVVKTRQQVDPWLQNKSMFDATVEIIKKGGPFALLAGLGPTALGYLIEGAFKFGIYEVSKPFTQRFVAAMATFFSFPALDSRIISLLMCGFISGTAASFMLSPMEALRIRMVSDSDFSGKSSINAFITMLRKEGMASISKGLPAMLSKQIPYTITKNVSFDLFTTWAYRIWLNLGNSITGNVKFAIPLVSAMTAAMLSCISSHPGDMLLSLVNAHEGPKRTRDFIKDIWRGEDGVRGFFVGIKPRFVHVLVIVTVQLLIYDFVKRLVGIAATGMG